MGPPSKPSTGIVVGNPKARSRTRDVAEAVALSIEGTLGLTEAERVTVDLADLGPQLFDWSSSAVKQAVEAIAACPLVIVASPTYKASYTRLLKAFLDWYPTTVLAGVTVVPVMVGAGLQHALAVEVHLRPVLVEIGATLPTRGLFVAEDQLDDVESVIRPWLSDAEPGLRASLRSNAV